MCEGMIDWRVTIGLVILAWVAGFTFGLDSLTRDWEHWCGYFVG